jgi:hypothetical protein
MTDADADWMGSGGIRSRAVEPGTQVRYHRGWPEANEHYRILPLLERCISGSCVATSRTASRCSYDSGSPCRQEPARRVFHHGLFKKSIFFSECDRCHVRFHIGAGGVWRAVQEDPLRQSSAWLAHASHSGVVRRPPIHPLPCAADVARPNVDVVAG